MKFQRGVIQKGIWWRSAVRLDGEMIVPVPPFHPYNVFDFYYPLERALHSQKTASLCYERKVVWSNNSSSLAVSEKRKELTLTN